MNTQLKYFFLFFLFIICTVTAHAKVHLSDSTQHEYYKNLIAINFSEPILKVLSKNTGIDSGFNPKAPILYIGRQTCKMLYRMGGRVSMKNSRDESDLFTDKIQAHYNKYDLTLSALRLKPVNSRINIGYGPCASSFFLLDKKIYDSGFDKVAFNNTSWSVAAGINFLGQYKINKRLSVFAEYILAYQYVRTYSGKEFSAFPEENYANEKSIQHGIQFDYPLSLYITYHF